LLIFPEIDPGWLRGLFLGHWVALNDAHDVRLLHDQEFLAVELYLGARPFTEQDAIARLHLEGDDLALLVAGSRTGCDDLTLHRLFLSSIRNDDAPHSLPFGIEGDGSPPDRATDEISLGSD
jgi:hypothetical protein